MTYSYQYARRHGYKSTLYNPFEFRYILEKNGTFRADIPKLGFKWKKLGEPGYHPGLRNNSFDLVSLQSRYEEIMRARAADIQQEVRGFFIPAYYR